MEGIQPLAPAQLLPLESGGAHAFRVRHSIVICDRPPLSSRDRSRLFLPVLLVPDLHGRQRVHPDCVDLRDHALDWDKHQLIGVVGECHRADPQEETYEYRLGEIQQGLGPGSAAAVKDEPPVGLLYLARRGGGREVDRSLLVAQHLGAVQAALGAHEQRDAVQRPAEADLRLLPLLVQQRPRVGGEVALVELPVLAVPPVVEVVLPALREPREEVLGPGGVGRAHAHPEQLAGHIVRAGCGGVWPSCAERVVEVDVHPEIVHVHRPLLRLLISLRRRGAVPWAVPRQAVSPGTVQVVQTVLRRDRQRVAEKHGLILEAWYAEHDDEYQDHHAACGHLGQLLRDR
mmetsp:Transcript_7164/g.19540  ORF Transcript_7164/g.19540 Transcript_7164/m.19540 type:complete len:345 (-) Transcript_7164:823-1857(-)